MPLAHVGGLSIQIRSAVYGTTVLLHERFDTSARWPRSWTPSSG